jgi:hypothetical protein
MRRRQIRDHHVVMRGRVPPTPRVRPQRQPGRERPALRVAQVQGAGEGRDDQPSDNADQW